MKNDVATRRKRYKQRQNLLDFDTEVWNKALDNSAPKNNSNKRPQSGFNKTLLECKKDSLKNPSKFFCEKRIVTRRSLSLTYHEVIQ